MIEYNVPGIDSFILKEKNKILKDVSRDVFSYQNYAGHLSPWHDKADVFYKTWDTSKLFTYVADNNMDLKSYCILASMLAPPSRFRSPGNLYGVHSVKSWLRMFREYCEEDDIFIEVADVSFHLLQHQSKGPHRVYFTQSNTVKAIEEYDGMEEIDTRAAKKYVEVYHILADRIRKFRHDKIDPKLWIEAKYKKCVDSFKDDVAFSAIARINSLDPDSKHMAATTNDEWRSIREFLGVSPSCEFTNGYIPKGWRPASDERADLQEVIDLRGDGYYYYPDGTQRRGQRHYAQNQYLVIKCTPENFDEFKESWDDKRLVMNNPTWEEYNKYGVEPKYYEESGNNINEGGIGVTWRTR